MTLENCRLGAPKISKTTPSKVAGGGRHPTKQLDASGKSGAFFHYSEILHAPVARNCGRVGRDCSRKILTHD
jgi:hypothetical protein